MERYQQHFHALGSEVLLTIVSESNKEDVQDLFTRLRSHITVFEKQFSRFLPDSELTAFNQSAGERTNISRSFNKLLIAAQDLAEKTNGIYNPFILPALQKAGYQGSWPHPEQFQSATDYTSSNVVPIHELIINDTWAKIPLHTALDFGGIGKGYLLDELAHILEGENMTGFWFSLGGDIICGGHDLDGQDWKVAVGGATDTSDLLATLTNPGGKQLAIATSGITKRQGHKRGKPWHHLIDPRTGQSAETDILTATASSDHAVIADVFAKCIVIGGIELAEQYRSENIIQSYVIQLKNSTAIIKGLVRE